MCLLYLTNKLKNEMKHEFSYFKAPIKNIHPADSITISRLAEGIRSDYAKGITDELRRIPTTNEDARREYKAQHFDYACFSGIFTQRGARHLKEYSGLMVLDFDGVDVERTKAKLLKQQDVDTVLMFTSPSGDGVKWIVPATTEDEHLRNFRMYQMFCEKVLELSVDESGKDVARACFLPHDPGVVVRQIWKFRELPTFLTQLSQTSFEDRTIKRTEQNGDSPFADYDRRGDVLRLLQARGWKVVKKMADKVQLSRPGKKDKGVSADFRFDDRLLYIFTDNSVFEASRAFAPATVYAVLECGGDMKEARQRLIKDGYGSDARQMTAEARQVIKSTLPERLQAIVRVNGWDAEKIKTQEQLEKKLAEQGERLAHYPLNPKFIELKNYTDTQEWMEAQIIKSEQEIYDKIRELYVEIISDESARLPASRKELYFIYDTFFQAYNRLSYFPDKLENFARATATQMWVSVFAPRLLQKNVRRMFYFEPNRQKAEDTQKRIMQVYNFSSFDMEKIRYFICQCKDENLDPSLNKILYIWARQKFTGKTTVGAVITSILNGEESTDNYGYYSSDLGTEMQMGTHDIPVATRTRCTLMDEAFFKNMERVYPKFKKMVTSDTASINIKYKTPVSMPCRRNYIMASNEPLEKHIKDFSDRRYLDVNMNHRPERLSREDIFQMWRDYIVNVTPEKNMAEWYEEMLEATEVEGEYRKRTNDIKNDMLTQEFIGAINKSERYITISRLAKVFHLAGYDRPERFLLNEAALELFGEPTISQGRWVMDDVVETLDALSESTQENIFAGKAGDVPF